MQEKSKILYKIIRFNSKIDSKIGAILYQMYDKNMRFCKKTINSLWCWYPSVTIVYRL